MPKNALAKIVDWLRAGYPQGVPQGDYVALLGVLHRSLTDVEVDAIVAALVEGPEGADGEIDPDEVREAIKRYVHEEPSAEDIDRVLERIDAGWRTQHRGSESGS
ncbi:DUF3349 domain-containing protein [Luteococcus sediminum]|uniref:DUF3349 domain-containing protein n=1 Tax=Luteococcus sp. TaxID=1969402 RepID=UPI0037366544